MKKNILTLTLATAAIFSTSAFAQSAGDNSASCPAAPCGAPCAPGYNCNTPCPYFQNPDSCMMNPFAELNLTADQQAKIKELRTKKFQQKTKDIKNKRELRQAKRQAYLYDLKSILTPEQYVQYLEQSYVNGPAFGKGYKQPKSRKHHKGQRYEGKRYNCQQPTGCPAAPCQNATPATK